jgi:hypothetical protein
MKRRCRSWLNRPYNSGFDLSSAAETARQAELLRNTETIAHLSAQADRMEARALTPFPDMMQWYRSQILARFT